MAADIQQQREDYEGMKRDLERRIQEVEGELALQRQVHACAHTHRHTDNHRYTYTHMHILLYTRTITHGCTHTNKCAHTHIIKMNMNGVGSTCSIKGGAGGGVGGGGVVVRLLDRSQTV